MAEQTNVIAQRVLIVDDNPDMTKELKEKFEEFNDGKITLSLELPSNIKWEFEVETADSPDTLIKCLHGRPSFDVIVLDRKFSGVYLAKSLLHSLNDLQIDCLRIVWTAYPEPEPKNLIECMRLGAWDYLVKTKARYEDTYVDVIVSTIEGLHEKEVMLNKAKLDKDGHKFIVDNYDDIYSRHKGNFLAFEKDKEGNWQIEPVAKDQSLFGLYYQLKQGDRDRRDFHITWIQA